MRLQITLLAAVLGLSACEEALSVMDDGLDNARDARLASNGTTDKSRGIRVLNTQEELAVFKQANGISASQTVVQADAENMVVVDEVVTELDITGDTAAVSTTQVVASAGECDPNAVLPYAGQSIDALPTALAADAIYLLPNAKPSDVEAGKLNVFLDEAGLIAFAKCG